MSGRKYLFRQVRWNRPGLSGTLTTENIVIVVNLSLDILERTEWKCHNPIPTSKPSFHCASDAVLFSRRRKFTAVSPIPLTYGPLGAELLNNIRQTWWRYFINAKEDMVGLDSAIILHPQTWVASGHVDSFTDPLVEDKITHKRYRVDHLIEKWFAEHDTGQGSITVDGMSLDEMAALIEQHNIQSPDGNPITTPKAFNIMFKTGIGAVAGEKTEVYLRGETAQGFLRTFSIS